ncbi:pyridine nucleotide-disulfide oxidoreductase [Phycicoccus sp. Soil803]|uniref:pyridine nucleotide-disulfide oxidoreductase n=1 Tax=Phycicoccus sp. Soil803 TaxID=1736415 RepID=UPI00070B4D0E|nr:pyridine nucleotide-disulfide oxidoreductase [Phycicoccus sp. Soil803]KRF23437.1 pyridine nucleotide-disulfide oxidoreductase [Phycicoccus sp. Soil803]
MTRTLEVDYLVVGAGAMGMAFTDSLVDHAADVRVALVDRRHGVSGHWLAAYPFVRLHQSSAFYGVASTLLGGGQLQQRGPEKGLQERASQPEICAYYAKVLDRLVDTGRVEFFPNSEYAGDRSFTSRVSGERFEIGPGCRVVNARYLAPSIPAEKAAPFGVADDVRLIPVNELAQLDEAPSQYVVVGAGKTATDACIWLLARGVAPDSICWVRAREPWMYNRAHIQPDPAIFLGASADIVEAAVGAETLDEVMLRLEERDVVLRIDRTVTPTMAKTPTLATWELDQLRTLENVVRLGHLQTVDRGRLTFGDASVAIHKDALVVHCAADGLKYPGRVPVWRPDVITLQAIRAGFPSFGAAVTGYIEATRDDDDEKNRICSPSVYGNSLQEWAQMIVFGSRNAAAYTAEPDIKEWATGVALNPARTPPGYVPSQALDDATERLAKYGPPGIARLAELMG